MQNYMIFIPILLVAFFVLFEIISLFFPKSLGRYRTKIVSSDEFKTTITLIVGIASVTSVIYSIVQIKNINDQTTRSSLISQAKEISAWNASTAKIYNDSTSDSQGTFRQNVIINNRSNAPIYNVFVLMFSTHTDPKQQIKIAISNNSVQHFEVIPPGKSTITINTGIPQMGGRKQLPVIYFTDTSNKQWLRSLNGHLVEYTGYEKMLNNSGFTLPYTDGLINSSGNSQ